MNVHQRINAVMKAVTYVQKDKTVEGGGSKYKAVTHDKVVSVIRASMVENGLVVEVTQTAGRMLVMRDGVNIKMHLYEGEYDVSIVNSENPSERVTVHVHAHANDNGDKAPGKAMTYATKMALLKSFSLETGEDDESRSGQGSIDVDSVRLTIDATNDLDTLRKLRQELAAKCEKAHDKDAWAHIKSATEVRAKELQQ